MADIPSAAQALYPNLPSAAAPPTEARAGSAPARPAAAPARSLASALSPDLAAETPAVVRPAAPEGRSIAEKIFGTDPGDGLEKARESIAAGVARPAAEIEAEAAEQGEAGAFGLPSGALTDQFSALVKESGLSEAGASKMADLHRKALTDASTQYWDQQSTNWTRETRRQFGSQLDTMVGSVKPLLADNRLTTPGFCRLLDEYRLGNNPDFVRTLAAWAAAMKGRR